MVRCVGCRGHAPGSIGGVNSRKLKKAKVKTPCKRCANAHRQTGLWHASPDRATRPTAGLPLCCGTRLLTVPPVRPQVSLSRPGYRCLSLVPMCASTCRKTLGRARGGAGRPRMWPRATTISGVLRSCRCHGRETVPPRVLPVSRSGDRATTSSAGVTVRRPCHNLPCANRCSSGFGAVAPLPFFKEPTHALLCPFSN
jgi:hypothetical protein